MKTDKRVKHIGIIAAAVLVTAGICGGICFWRVQKREAMLHQQNYAASRLIEMGEYEQGRILAAQSGQMKANAVSEELLVLAAGFQADYEAGLIYAEKYLEKREDAIIASAKEIYQDALEELGALSREDPYQYTEAYYARKEKSCQKLLGLLLQVQNGIPVKKAGGSMAAVVDLMAGTGTACEAAARLEGDNSLLSLKAQISCAVRTGNYQQAFEQTERLYSENNTLENRALLANLAVEQGSSFGENAWVDALRTQQREQQEEYRALEAQHAQESSSTRQSRISRRMETVRERIEEIQREIEAVPALKAVSFLEAATPAAERSTTAYQMELAQLYFRAGQPEKARELLIDLVKKEGEDMEPAGLLFADLLRGYANEGGLTGTAGLLPEERADMKTLWNRIAGLLGFIETSSDYGAASFYHFVMETFNELYHGIIIRSIDAVDFPTVRVTVNVSMELENELEKRNFSLTELGKPLKDFRILDREEREHSGALSVVLVVDRSGSMDGTPMEDTKKAVAGFVRTIDETIETGLIAFDNSAQVIVPITSQKNSVLQGTASLQAVGGTNIYSGLQLAGQELDGKSGRKVIILLSDGEDGSGSIIDEVLEELNRRSIYVYAIGFGGADTEYLGYIAQKCGGKFIQADSSEMLGEIYASIGEYMVNDYVIEFEIVTEPEEFTRTIKVSVDVSDAVAERKYHVGVPYEAIKEERNRKPLADYFRQVGGSWMETE